VTGQPGHRDGCRATTGAAARTGPDDSLSSESQSPVARCDNRLPPTRLAVVWLPAPPVFAARFQFLYIAFFWGFLGGELKTNGGRFSLGLALKTPLGRSKVVRLG